MKTRDLLQILERFHKKSEVGSNANVFIVNKNKQNNYNKIIEIRLAENKLIGQSETHRLVIVVEPE
jgi:hypothetical protein